MPHHFRELPLRIRQERPLEAGVELEARDLLADEKAVAPLAALLTGPLAPARQRIELSEALVDETQGEAEDPAGQSRGEHRRQLSRHEGADEQRSREAGEPRAEEERRG